MIVLDSSIKTSGNTTLDYLNNIEAARGKFKMSGGIDSFILANGRSFNVVADTFTKYPKQKDKECFANAYYLAQTSKGKLFYAEGYGNAIIPMHHAFCVDKDGNVYDNTWRTGQDYYGIVFDLEKVRKNIFTSGYWGMFLDDWKNKWPILNGKVKLESVIDKRFYSKK